MSISARNRSRRVRFFFIACVRPGKAGCFGIGAAPLKVTPILSDDAGKRRFFRDSPSINLKFHELSSKNIEKQMDKLMIKVDV
jgi:hypothetical protein